MDGLAEAIAFLVSLGIDPTEKQYFRTFPDRKKGQAKNHCGVLAELWPTLQAENDKGNGVFMVINAGGQTKSEITATRAVFADSDNGMHWSRFSVNEMFPHAVVESSPGKWHAYWRTNGLQLSRFEQVQTAIASRFDTDPSIKDLSRVMRLPGFLHQKGEPHRVKLVAWTDHRWDAYSQSEVLEWKSRRQPFASTPTAGNRNSTLTRIAGGLRRNGATEEEMVEHLLNVRTEPPLEAAEVRQIAKSVSRYPAGQRPASATDAHCLAQVDLHDLMSAKLEPPQFLIDPLLPRGCVTLLGGHGGCGKSFLALIIAAHAAAGAAWNGYSVLPGKVIFVSLEDPGEVVKYRLRKIVQAYRLDANAVMENIQILEIAGGSPCLMAEDRRFGDRNLVATPNLLELKVASSGSDLLIIDNASDAFDGDENNRRQVRQFVRSLAEIGTEHGCAVLVLAHIDKHSAKNGSSGNSYSGSTAWHNSARSRLALLSDDEGSVRLVHEKCNFGKTAEELRFRWSADGSLMPVDASAIEQARQASAVGDASRLLEVLRVAWAKGESVPVAQSGPRTAWEILQYYPELKARFPNGKSDKKRVLAALGLLNREHRIKKEEFKNSQRKVVERWVAALVELHVPCAPVPPHPQAHTGALGSAGALVDS